MIPSKISFKYTQDQNRTDESSLEMSYVTTTSHAQWLHLLIKNLKHLLSLYTVGANKISRYLTLNWDQRIKYQKAKM